MLLSVKLIAFRLIIAEDGAVRQVSIILILSAVLECCSYAEASSSKDRGGFEKPKFDRPLIERGKMEISKQIVDSFELDEILLPSAGNNEEKFRAIRQLLIIITFIVVNYRSVRHI